MIISVTDVKNFLSGISSTSTDNDITTLIGQNQRKAEKYVGYAFETASVDEVLKLENTDILKLNNLPVNSITAIKDLDNNTLDVSVIDICNDTKKTGVFTLSKVLNQRIKVEYSAGYASNAAPDDLKQAVIKLVAADLLQGKTLNSMDESQANAYTPASFRKSAYDILDEYKIWSI
jgi:hypothetical protein